MGPQRGVPQRRGGASWQSERHAVVAVGVTHFADSLILRLRQLGHPLCVGLDPHLDLVPPLFRRGSMHPRDPATAAAVEEFLLAVLDRYAGSVAVVKPQSAFFEQLGWRGIQVLDRVVRHSRELGLLVLLDAKRGDIDSTAAAYAAYLDPAGALPVDAITVNPYLGRDTLAPFVRAAQQHGSGIFVLVKTSNAGASDYQDRLVGGQHLYEIVAESLRVDADGLRGPLTQWSSLGIVVGATQPDDAPRIRELLPRALFLVPGYGAQGGGAAAAVRGFVRGPSGGLEGGIVNSSRGVLFPPESNTADVSVWERAIDEARRRTLDDLSSAVQQ